ncbi:MAG: SEC-C domain-containing protein, partial [Neisseriaceae bacterium]|nr:SEC-C domain-containing protein [Neisseriaceae bacterium]
AKTEMVGEENMAQFERNVFLGIIDHKWREHLARMDYLRQGIHLRGYAQKNPKQEYKREAFELFQGLLSSVYREMTEYLVKIRVQLAPPPETEETPVPDDEDYSPEALAAKGLVVRRNDLCPCGSGEKYKNCHGKLA